MRIILNASNPEMALEVGDVLGLRECAELSDVGGGVFRVGAYQFGAIFYTSTDVVGRGRVGFVDCYSTIVSHISFIEFWYDSDSSRLPCIFSSVSKAHACSPIQTIGVTVDKVGIPKACRKVEYPKVAFGAKESDPKQPTDVSG